MLQHLRLIPLFFGLAVGVLLVLFYKAPRKVIYEYPHPQNVTERVYRDNNGVCYKYNAKQVDCDANESTLRQYPLQT
jgi:hypothetical protein